MLAYGDFRIHPLPEGRFTVGADKRFVPYPDGQQAPRGTPLVSVTPFLIESRSDLILLDTGLGEYATGRDITFLLDGIRRAGFRREDVSRVVLSHLHIDHCGGAVLDAGGHDQPTFPQATYYLQAGEVHAPEYRGLAAQARDRVVRTLGAAGQLELLDGDTWITAEVEVERTGGHTSHHQIARLHSGGRTAVFGGDVLPAAGQALRSFRAKYDLDPERSHQVRASLVRQAADAGHLLLFYHATHAPAGYVVEERSGMRVEAAIAWSDPSR